MVGVPIMISCTKTRWDIKIWGYFDIFYLNKLEGLFKNNNCVHNLDQYSSHSKVNLAKINNNQRLKMILLKLVNRNNKNNGYYRSFWLTISFKSRSYLLVRIFWYWVMWEKITRLRYENSIRIIMIFQLRMNIIR